ncbi:MAG TPA: MFS transporter [Thermomicrobiales bacterium]|nr:MFS transporter [Thermomicrobiales bacterium]
MRLTPTRLEGLWRHPDFLKLWGGQTISVFGDQIALLALPLVAVLTLNAGAVEMGILGAAERAPFLLVGLFAGVWVDRLRRRPILIGADAGRALLLGSIPAAALLGALTVHYLYVIAFLVGILTVFFDVAYQSYLPVLVSRERLVEGNSKLEVSNSVATIAGPGLAGALVQLLSAPLALLADALSFVVSVVSLLWIGAPEPAPRPADAADGARAGLWREIGEGLRVVLGNRLLRAIAGCTGTSNLFGSMMFAVFVLYATRDLGLSPALLGVVLAAFGPGGLLGALLAGPAARRLGVGPAIVGSIAVGGVAGLLVPLAAGPAAVTVPLLMAWGFVSGVTTPIYNITQVSLRQQITPDRVQGRMNATMRFIVWGTMPIGALAGGFLGQFIGLRPTLLVGAVGSLLAILWVFFSPVRALREQPPPVEEDAPVLAGTAVGD